MASRTDDEIALDAAVLIKKAQDVGVPLKENDIAEIILRAIREAKSA